MFERSKTTFHHTDFLFVFYCMNCYLCADFQWISPSLAKLAADTDGFFTDIWHAFFLKRKTYSDYYNIISRMNYEKKYLSFLFCSL